VWSCDQLVQQDAQVQFYEVYVRFVSNNMYDIKFCRVCIVDQISTVELYNSKRTRRSIMDAKYQRSHSENMCGPKPDTIPLPTFVNIEPHFYPTPHRSHNNQRIQDSLLEGYSISYCVMLDCFCCSSYCHESFEQNLRIYWYPNQIARTRDLNIEADRLFQLRIVSGRHWPIRLLLGIKIVKDFRALNITQLPAAPR
jgi:hypothetical protein